MDVRGAPSQRARCVGRGFEAPLVKQFVVLFSGQEGIFVNRLARCWGVLAARLRESLVLSERGEVRQQRDQ
eukprot:12934964-Prorocentrum_lima.AAC.1